MGSEGPYLGLKRLDLGSEGLILGGGTETGNRSPKGNMWSAIPIALLCMVVNPNGGSRAAAPKGTKSCRTQGGLFQA